MYVSTFCTGNGLQEIILAGGLSNWYGRIEVFVNETSFTMCADKWDLTDATVVCRQLGFSSAIESYASETFGVSFGAMWENVYCKGDEFSISECEKRYWFEIYATFYEKTSSFSLYSSVVSTCSLSYNVGVFCKCSETTLVF